MSFTQSFGLVSADVISQAIAWRRDLHRHPELAFNERRTADLVASELAGFGLQVHRGLGGTGVVGTLRRGTSERTIAIRADMDALPIQERGGVEYASRTVGVMHACGHDGHTAMALAAASECARLPDLDGIVHFVFQPAEESEGGARRMMADGLFKLFPCEAVFALHNWPATPLGSCVALDGPMMAALAIFEITIEGRGCHGAMPHEGTDSLVAGSHLIGALQTIVSRSIGPHEPAVVSATQINAGDTWNVIPERCVIRGTTRWFSTGVGDLIEERIRQLAVGVASAYGCAATVRYERRFPATINTRAEAEFVRSVAVAPPLGLKVLETAPSMGSEDFACMLEAVPGCYLWLGSQSNSRQAPLHSPHYDFNDDLVPIGVALWVSLVRARLKKGANSS